MTDSDCNILLSVEMITYKHEGYIKQAIEGVLMQETNFDFELIIADDCSPDDTAKVVGDIIKDHPKGYRINYFRQATNIGMNANADFAIANCKGKYIAICEGDDYWTDSLKLQKQVDFLEANPDYGLVHTNYKTFLELENKEVSISRPKDNNKSLFKSILLGNYGIGTLTVCFRKEMYLDYLEDIYPFSKEWLMGDLPLWLFISQNSKIFYIEEDTSVYRVLGESASQTKDFEKFYRFELSTKDIRLFFCKKYYSNDKNLVKSIESIYLYRSLAGNAEFKGDFFLFKDLLRDFFKKNNSLNYSIRVFYQIYKKLKKELFA